MTTSAATTRTKRRSFDAGQSTEPKRDPYQVVTDAIVAAIEAGTKPWEKSWANGKGYSSYPLRHSGEKYRGINILLLWARQMEAGFVSPFWMTYQQALELGGQVRRGEKGTMVCYYGQAKKDEPASTEDGPNVYRFLKTFTVFNCDQVDNLPDRYRITAPQVIPISERIPEVDAIIAATGADIRHGGNRAYYRPATDTIQLPEFTAFHSAEAYAGTAFHELIHWTKAKHRLDRSFDSTGFGDSGYAREELVAELGAAFIGAELGFAPEHLEDHASYIASWLKALKEDKRAIFSIAAKAQAAADYVLGRHTATAEGE